MVLTSLNSSSGQCCGLSLSHDCHMTLICTMHNRDWRDCKYALLKRFKNMVDGLRKKGAESGKGVEPESQLVLNMLLGIVDEENAHSYALLLLWASQSNAIPVSRYCSKPLPP